MATDFTSKMGTAIKDFITDKFKYKIFIKSVPYNKKGAYAAMESGYICIEDDLYNELTQNAPIKELYVSYYNNMKPHNHKTLPNMPKNITIDQIESISIAELPLDYVQYWER